MLGLGGKSGDNLKGIAGENVVALCEVDGASLDRIAARYPQATRHRDFRRILEQKDIDAVVVTTPSDVSLDDARKAIQMFQQVKVDVLGIVENMSYLHCPHCRERVDVFGHGGGRRTAERYDVPFLGELPLNPDVRIGGDTGMPVVLRGADDPLGQAFIDVGRRVAARISLLDLTGPTESILHVKM